MLKSEISISTSKYNKFFNENNDFIIVIQPNLSITEFESHFRISLREKYFDYYLLS